MSIKGARNELNFFLISATTVSFRPTLFTAVATHSQAVCLSAHYLDPKLYLLPGFNLAIPMVLPLCEGKGRSCQKKTDLRFTDYRCLNYQWDYNLITQDFFILSQHILVPSSSHNTVWSRALHIRLVVCGYVSAQK